MTFFEHYMRQPADAYLAAHDGQVPTFEQVLADLSAQRPRRAELLGIAADALRQDLLDWQAPAPPISTTAAFADLAVRLWRSPQRELISGMLRAALDEADLLAAMPDVAQSAPT